MMRIMLTAGLMVCALAGPVRAAEPAVCKELQEEFDAARKRILFTRSQIWAENSAARATNLQIEIMQELVSQQANIGLMAQAKCTMPGLSVKARPDPAKTGACGNAMLEQQLAATRGQKKDLGDACKFD